MDNELIVGDELVAPDRHTTQLLVVIAILLRRLGGTTIITHEEIEVQHSLRGDLLVQGCPEHGIHLDIVETDGTSRNTH